MDDGRIRTMFIECQIYIYLTSYSKVQMFKCVLANRFSFFFFFFWLVNQFFHSFFLSSFYRSSFHCWLFRSKRIRFGSMNVYRKLMLWNRNHQKLFHYFYCFSLPLSLLKQTDRRVRLSRELLLYLNGNVSRS